ncbi:hypothetical protein AXF42_Ash018857 [Apostasia shenzhenica]|uniref:Rab-GAP TBC domain-containing protein n=1 Tax=Apostasia shenzhenica TaxID=1088818 RepID=A0A2I0B4Z5_9ASPA|nr:hypothetical protein AXF42_Ash018857 [Apostasia shenzhenica]
MVFLLQGSISPAVGGADENVSRSASDHITKTSLRSRGRSRRTGLDLPHASAESGSDVFTREREREKPTGSAEMMGMTLQIVTAEYNCTRSERLNPSTDAYGFAVRPQHLPRYKEYAKIYKEEEEEKSQRWKIFLQRLAESTMPPTNDVLDDENNLTTPERVLGQDGNVAKVTDCDDSEGPKGEKQEDLNQDEGSEVVENEIHNQEEGGKLEIFEEGVLVNNCDQTRLVLLEDLNRALSSVAGTAMQGLGSHKDLVWIEISPSICAVGQLMSYRVKSSNLPNGKQILTTRSHLASIDEETPTKEFPNKDSDEEFYDVDRADAIQGLCSNGNGNTNLTVDQASKKPSFPWKKELECLVRGGLPIGLRGEIWQAFVGVRVRKVDGYYRRLLSPEAKSGDMVLRENGSMSKELLAEKWKGQIEKDLPRTFPGHPALDEDGRNALRRLLTAYARHKPSVGYCQAMNFFAGLLLLLMPEENAFWTLLGIMDDYFEGYYSEEMIESQVDQLVFEDIVRVVFPKLVNHLDYLGVEVAWVSGPWFLSIFLNILPWESVLRVWDVLLFDGNRVMLFRTALALMELYGPALVTTKDAGDAVTLLQSLAGSTFDSSQLVLTACMGYQTIDEVRLLELREKYRPEVVAAMEERSRGIKDSKGLASKLYSFKHDPDSLFPVTKPTKWSGGNAIDELETKALEEFCNSDAKLDLKEQVTWLKVELCRLLEEKRSAVLRAEELETALMEMVKQDNRHLLSAKVESFKQDVSELRQALSDKQEHERAIVQVLMKVEQEQIVAEDARVSAEQDAAAQRYAASVLQISAGKV